MIPAIIAGGAALMGGAMAASNNSKNTYRTNEQNMAIAQMNNEWSERMMEKQNRYNIDQWMRESNFSAQQAEKANQFTLDMWNRSNAYNSASAQRARYEAAGLNPYMMMNGGNAGVAQSASGAQASTPSGNSVGLPSPSTATMIPSTFGGFGKALSDAAAAFINMNASSSQSDYNRAMALSTLANMYEDVRNKRFQNKINDATESIQYAMKNEQYLSAVQSRINAGLQEKLVAQQITYQELVNAGYNDELSARLSNMASSSFANYAAGRLSKQQLLVAVQNMYKLAAETQGIRLNNNIISKTASDVVDKYAHEAKLTEQQVRLTEKQGDVVYWNTGFNGLSNLVQSVLLFGLGKLLGPAAPVIKGFR